MLKHFFLTKTFGIPCLLIFFLNQSALAALSPIRHHRLGRWEFQLSASQFNTQHNFDHATNSYSRLENYNYYRLINLDFDTRWGFTKKWALFSSLTVAHAIVAIDNEKTTGTSADTLAFGIDYRMYSSWVRLIPELSYTYPFKRITKNQNRVITGEGAGIIQARLLANAKWRRSISYLYLGIRYLDEGRATQMPIGFGSRIKFTDFALLGGIEGYFPVITDRYSNKPSERDDVTDAVSGGSKVFYAVNPMAARAIGQLSFYFASRFYVTLEVSQTFAGRNTAHGTTYLLSLNYVNQPRQYDNFKFDPEIEKAQQEWAEKKDDIGRQLEKFVEEHDKESGED